jgi:hypothetical protein
MAFSDLQQKLFTAKLDGRYVRARQKNGVALLYIEEACHRRGQPGIRLRWLGPGDAHGRVHRPEHIGRGLLLFLSWSGPVPRAGRRDQHSPRRDRIRVWLRDESADAHELAIKDAENDATKRALATFSNLFGLALYDRARSAVKNKHLIEGLQERDWVLRNGSGEAIAVCPDPQSFCAALRRLIQAMRGPLEADAEGESRVGDPADAKSPSSERPQACTTSICSSAS